MTRFSCVDDCFRRCAAGLILRGRVCSKSDFTNPLLPVGPDPWVIYHDKLLLLHEHHREEPDYVEDQRYYRFEGCGKEGRLDPPPTGPYAHDLGSRTAFFELEVVHLLRRRRGHE